jgi:ATP-dependent Clp protease adapter protein ClpS
VSAKEFDDSKMQVIFQDDDLTPADFATGLLISVFGKSQTQAAELIEAIQNDGKAVCGVYPPAVANIMLETVTGRIKAAGHSLIVTSLPVDPKGLDGTPECAFCGEKAVSDQTMFKGKSAYICDNCLAIGANNLSSVNHKRKFKYAYEALRWHFAGLAQDEIASSTRRFPGHMRADVQAALNALFVPSPIRFFGINERHRYETLTYAALAEDGQHAATISAAQYQDIEIGEDDPVKCLNNGLWLRREGDLRYAVVLSFHREFGQESGTCVEIAVPVGEEGSAFVESCFKEIESVIAATRSYRGKVLSFEQEPDYRGRSKGIMVHRLPEVRREDVILPEATIKLLDRNILDFVGSRSALRSLGQSTRKGVLLYGPPGTGKTHTIRYLAKSLPDHTTLIITAGQIALLAEYMNLARLLQPAMVVIEDVDLIARNREDMGGPCEETMLNSLLNEMDGLKENSDILFVLTTNRPEQLEGALAGRPGRIDQAIEVPLPDEDGRAKLVRLYGAGLDLSDEMVAAAASRTQGVSASFIKELMRRVAQSSISGNREAAVISDDISEALDDMLFSGGRLNVKLLGGAGLEHVS